MIYINDKEHPFDENQSLKDLFIQLQLNVEKGFAIALNNQVIPRSEWENKKLANNDKLLLIKATQGG